MRHTVSLSTVLVVLSSTLATPIQASPVPPPSRTAVRVPAAAPAAAPSAAPHPLAAAALYSRRSRRLVQSYLRLKLLEMRERDLDLARKVIERKTGIGTALGETPAPRAW